MTDLRRLFMAGDVMTDRIRGKVRVLQAAAAAHRVEADRLDREARKLLGAGEPEIPRPVPPQQTRKGRPT